MFFNRKKRLHGAIFVQGTSSDWGTTGLWPFVTFSENFRFRENINFYVEGVSPFVLFVTLDYQIQFVFKLPVMIVHGFLDPLTDVDV